MNSTEHNRESGFYWVKHGEASPWTAAYWDGSEWLMGRIMAYRYTPHTINETRILNPDEEPERGITIVSKSVREREQQ